MNTLRDGTQWLVHGEPALTAGMEAIEVIALVTAGAILASGTPVEIRAQGNVMLKWAEARERTMLRGTDEQQVAIGFAREVLDWLGGHADKPEEALSELHSVAFGFDSLISGAGITGEGWFRTLARGEHGR